MEQRRALNALEPYVLLSKSATSPRGAVDLILQAISSPQTYVFAELLQTPNIQALRSSPEHSQYLKLLEIFSYGTYADYKSSSSLPELTIAQIQKLRQLTLLTLARQQSPLQYQTLQTALSLPDSISLESLVSTAHAASLLTGTLDPQAQLVYIDSVAPLRDLAPGNLPTLTNEITGWSDRCAKVLQQLDAESSQIRDRARLRTEKQTVLDTTFQQKLAEAQAAEEKGGRGKRVLEDKEGQGDNHDEMDIDDEKPTGRVKRTLMGMMRSGGA